MDLRPVTLEGRVVRLEPLSPGHLDGLCAVGLDPELWRLTASLVESRGDMERYVRTALDWQAAGTALPFAIVLREPETVVGSTRFANISVSDRRLEIGWTWVARTWQRTAVNTEVKFLLLEYAFETLGAVRVEFKTDVLNERSRRALARIGAVEEGTLRRHMRTAGGRWRDTVYFSILAEEWPGIRAVLQARRAGPGGVAGAPQP